MVSSENSKASRLKQKFGKDTEHSKVFENWDEAIQAWLLTQAELEDGELPVLVYFHQSTNICHSALLNFDVSVEFWGLITTRRIFWTNPNEPPDQLRHEDIDSVTFCRDPQKQALPSAADWDSIVEKSKQDLMLGGSWLHLVDFSSNEYRIFVDRKTAVQIRNLLWHLSGGWQLAASRAAQENEATRIKFQSGEPLYEKGTDPHKAWRLQRHILRYGVEYSSRFFEALTPEIQEFLLKEMNLQQGELPAFCFFENQETWFAASSRRVFWSRPGFKHQMKYGQIRRMGLEEMQQLNSRKRGWNALTKEQIIEEKNEAARIKTSSPWFYFLDDKGITAVALLPPGSPLFAIWNAILAIKRLEE